MQVHIQDSVKSMKWNRSLGAYQFQIPIMAKSYMNGHKFVRSKS